jgi:hypothetical protein
MGYLDPTQVDRIEGDEVITTWPAAAAPANGGTLGGAIRYITDALAGTAGIASYPAAAAPANAVSIAEVLSALYEHLRPKSATGTIAITDASQTESTPFPILTIAPVAGAPLRDCDVIIDLDKATTGFGAVETSITVQFAVERKIDGTNWRREAYVEAALSGTNAGSLTRSAKIPVGIVGVTEQARIVAVFSADVTSNLSLPYVCNYGGLAAPTFS